MKAFGLLELAAATCLVAPALAAQQAARPAPSKSPVALPLKHAPKPTAAAITVADLMTRLYIFADDSMMGREAGTEGNLKATAYLEAELRRLGLQPAGDSGTYFQRVPLVKRGVSEGSTLTIDGASAPLAMGTDYVPLIGRGVSRPIDGTQAVYGGVLGDTANMIAPAQAAGKLVILRAPTGRAPGFPGIGPTNPLAGAAAVAVVGLEGVPPGALAFARQPQITVPRAESAPASPLPVRLLVSTKTAVALLGASLDSVKVGHAGKTVRGTVAYGESPAPARNVVAVLPGSDPKLRGQYVALGSHSDHVGVRPLASDHDSVRAVNAARERLLATLPAGQRATPQQLASVRANVDSLRKLVPARRDSISNGADDDGSGSVAMLEIAEALAKGGEKPKRSVLFVWHTGEEKGLLGAQYFTDHPTVARDSIVAQLNMDMIGRGGADDIKNGGPGYLQLIGSRRLSTELGDLVETVNKDGKFGFTFDYQFDADGHPENYYCRSDHYMYARHGIPIVFFSTGDHRDYHQITDEPHYINYPHLEKVTRFVNALTLRVANLDHRVVVDKPKPDPNGPCRQ